MTDIAAVFIGAAGNVFVHIVVDSAPPIQWDWQWLHSWFVSKIYTRYNPWQREI
ncbi:hypothetical protein [Alteromonas sp. 14N.309.X.WAT.G.H12]|uniref:hypothetical protein n=1 Tax=Alteromonas sp. 14N.309.X.WAT.G.H12 TaxID=3120824 RepID=UPI002FD1218B